MCIRDRRILGELVALLCGGGEQPEGFLRVLWDFFAVQQKLGEAVLLSLIHILDMIIMKKKFIQWITMRIISIKKKYLILIL